MERPIHIGCARAANERFIMPTGSASGASGVFSHSPSRQEFSTTIRQRSKRLDMKVSNNSGASSPWLASSASTMASSIAIPAPLASCGVAVCAASPISRTRPLCQGAGRSSDPIGRYTIRAGS